VRTAEYRAAVKAVSSSPYWKEGQACLGCKRGLRPRLGCSTAFVASADRAGQTLRARRSGTTSRETAAFRGPDPLREAGRDELRPRSKAASRAAGELLTGGGTTYKSDGWFLEPARSCQSGRPSRLVRGGLRPGLPIFPYSDFGDAIAREKDHSLRLGSRIGTPTCGN